jgi:hypothetical protein
MAEEGEWSMIRKRETGFPLANKRGTRLRGDYAQTKRLDHDAIQSNRIMIWLCY